MGTEEAWSLGWVCKAPSLLACHPVLQGDEEIRCLGQDTKESGFRTTWTLP